MKNVWKFQQYLSDKIIERKCLNLLRGLTNKSKFLII